MAAPPILGNLDLPWGEGVGVCLNTTPHMLDHYWKGTYKARTRQEPTETPHHVRRSQVRMWNLDPDLQPKSPQQNGLGLPHCVFCDEEAELEELRVRIQTANLPDLVRTRRGIERALVTHDGSSPHFGKHSPT